MRRHPVSSSAIASVGHDVEGAVLEVEFDSGEVYRYFLVPSAVYDAMLAAPSVGRFFQQRIRDRYPTERV